MNHAFLPSFLRFLKPRPKFAARKSAERSRSRLLVEQLETRDLLNVAPIIHWLDFNIYSPTTNQQIDAHVGATDADNDVITFRYDWKVNGSIVKTVTTNSNSDTLDLSQPGFGNKGDTINVAVTPMDPYSAGAEVAISTTVANSPPVLNSIADLDLVEGDEVNFVVSAVDADGDDLTFAAEDLVPGLIITPYNSTSAVISGTVAKHSGSDPTKVFATRIIVSDGTDTDVQFCQVQATNFTITSLVINGVPAGNSWDNAIGLPAIGGTMNFTFTFTGVGARATGTNVYWTVFEWDPIWDDELWKEVQESCIGAGANGAFTNTVTFSLWINQSGHVAGGYESSGEARPDIIKVLLETYWGTNLRTSSNGIFVRS